jgi:hypothetical protein
LLLHQQEMAVSKQYLEFLFCTLCSLYALLISYYFQLLSKKIIIFYPNQPSTQQ